MKSLSAIHSFSLEGILLEGMLAGHLLFYVGASTVWGVANRALFIPFALSERKHIVKLFVVNGAVVAGNIDAAVYSLDGVKLTSNVAQAQAGASEPQAFNITDIDLGPGIYYWACALSNAAGTVTGFTLAVSGMLSAMGLAQMEAAYPLPAVAVLAQCTGTLFPLMGMTEGLVI